MAYTVSDIQAVVQDDLKDSSFNSTRILRYLNYAQSVIFNTHAFKFCEKFVTGPLTVGEYTYEYQTDHQSTIGGVLISPTDENDRVLIDASTYLPTNQFFDLYPAPDDLDNAMPTHWTEFESQFYFNCPVDKTYEFKLRYYRVPTTLSAAGDVPIVPVAFRELLELYCLFRAEKYRGNHDVAATYKQEFEDGLEAMQLRYNPAIDVGFHTMQNVRVRIDD